MLLVTATLRSLGLYFYVSYPLNALRYMERVPQWSLAADDVLQYVNTRLCGLLRCFHLGVLSGAVSCSWSLSCLERPATSVLGLKGQHCLAGWEMQLRGEGCRVLEADKTG